MTVLPAPPDLAALIDAFVAAAAARDHRARLAAHYALLHWGLRKRHRYVHGGTSVALIWGSLKVSRWPATRPEPVRLDCRRGD